MHRAFQHRNKDAAIQNCQRKMLFPIFHLHRLLLLCLKILYTLSFTSSTVVISPWSLSQHGTWLNLKDNIFQMEIVFLSLIENRFPIWNQHPEYSLKKDKTVLAYPKSIGTGTWHYKKTKVSEPEVSFGACALFHWSKHVKY